MTGNLDVRLEFLMRTRWLAAAAITLVMAHGAAYAASAAEISGEAQAALKTLYAKVPAAKDDWRESAGGACISKDHEGRVGHWRPIW